MRRGRPPHPDLLTPREWEVFGLLRAGLTNKEIASRLGITERGAKYHVSEILSKLGMDTRREAATWRERPLRRFPLLAAVLARLRGMPAQLATAVLASAVLALFALALGVGVMERRSGKGETAVGQQEATQAPRKEMVRLAEEATTEARAVAPDNVLYLMGFAGGNGSYTFRFTVPGTSRDIVFVGPSQIPGEPRWQILNEDDPRLPAKPPALDVRSLQKSPVEVVQAMASKGPGAPSRSIGAHVFSDPATGELLWRTTARVGIAGGRSPDDSRLIQCELKDAAPVSTMTCNP
jgi:DNA-binding CsgD family transcriptional regulator